MTRSAPKGVSSRETIDANGSQASDSRRPSMDSTDVDPDVAILLSPSNVLSLTNTSTPAKPSPKRRSRPVSGEALADATLTLKWADDIRGRHRSSSEAAAATVAPSPSTPVSTTHGGRFTPINTGSILRSESQTSRSRSHTPTPILTPILLSPSKVPSKLGPGPPSAPVSGSFEPPSRRASDNTVSAPTSHSEVPSESRLYLFVVVNTWCSSSFVCPVVVAIHGCAAHRAWHVWNRRRRWKTQARRRQKEVRRCARR